MAYNFPPCYMAVRTIYSAKVWHIDNSNTQYSDAYWIEFYVLGQFISGEYVYELKHAIEGAQLHCFTDYFLGD